MCELGDVNPKLLRSHCAQKLDHHTFGTQYPRGAVFVRRTSAHWLVQDIAGNCECRANPVEETVSLRAHHRLMYGAAPSSTPSQEVNQNRG